jgi:hypothetical protein
MCSVEGKEKNLCALYCLVLSERCCLVPVSGSAGESIVRRVLLKHCEAALRAHRSRSKPACVSGSADAGVCAAAVRPQVWESGLLSPRAYPTAGGPIVLTCLDPTREIAEGARWRWIPAKPFPASNEGPTESEEGGKHVGVLDRRHQLYPLMDKIISTRHNSAARVPARSDGAVLLTWRLALCGWSVTCVQGRDSVPV